jgi:hypothetical protein
MKNAAMARIRKKQRKNSASTAYEQGAARADIRTERAGARKIRTMKVRCGIKAERQQIKTGRENPKTPPKRKLF